MTLFPPTHLVVCEIEGDRGDCCGAICVEDAGECSVDVARARLRDGPVTLKINTRHTGKAWALRGGEWGT